MGGSALCNTMRFTRTTMRAALPAVSATKIASRSVPGPRSSLEVTATVADEGVSAGEERCCEYQRPSSTNAARTMSTPTLTAVRLLVAMAASTGVFEHEHYVPGAPHSAAPKERIDGQ